MLKLTNTNGNIELARKMMKGDDGGYYIPSVVDGELTWTPSLEGMAAVDGKVNIVGPRGETGEPGFYVGTEEPTGEELVWINPDGDSLSEFATIDFVREEIAAIPEVDLTGLATEEFVNKEIDVIEKSVPNCASKESLGAYAKLTDLNAYSKKTDLNSYAKKSDIPSIDGLATEKYVNTAISNIEIPDAIDDYIVNFTLDFNSSNSECDRTSMEIYRACQEGKNIIVKANADGANFVMTPVIITNPQCIFTLLAQDLTIESGSGQLAMITVSLVGGLVNLIGAQLATAKELQEMYGQAMDTISQEFAQKSEIPDISGLATTGYVDEAISNIEVSGGAEDFIVEILIDQTYNETTTNKTSMEIAQANRDGKTIICKTNYDGTPIRLNSVVMADNLCLFTALMPPVDGDNSPASLMAIIIVDNSANYTFTSIITLPVLQNAWKEAFNTIGETYATKEFVEDAISNIELPEGGTVGGSSNFIVTITEDETKEENEVGRYQTDKTSKQIYDAYKAGKNVIVEKIENNTPLILEPVVINEYICYFSATLANQAMVGEENHNTVSTIFVGIINQIASYTRVESYTTDTMNQAFQGIAEQIEALPNEARVEEIATAKYEEAIEIYDNDLRNQLNTAFNGVVEIIDEKIADALGVIENGTY